MKHMEIFLIDVSLSDVFYYTIFINRIRCNSAY